jgi:hypothetical protein
MIDTEPPTFAGPVRYINPMFRNRIMTVLQVGNEVHARFSVFEPESVIDRVLWKLETDSDVEVARGSIDVAPQFSGGTLVATAKNLSLSQGDTVVMTITARNAAGLSASISASPIVLDLSPPILSSLQLDVDAAYHQGSIAVGNESLPVYSTNAPFKVSYCMSASSSMQFLLPFYFR